MQSLWKRTVVSGVGAFILLVAFTLAVFAQSGYFDNFEAPTFDPFWTLVQQNGTIQLSTDQSYSGTQSVKMSSPSGGGQRNIWLTHTFPQTTKGTLSVWWYDTLGNLYSGLYAFNSITGYQTSVGVYDNSLPLYVWTAGTPNYTTVPRTLGWHKLMIQFTPTGINFLIDDVLVGTANGDFSFDSVLLLLSGPSYDPAATFYFDDFTFAPPFTVPTTKDECKDGGWQNLSHADGSPFKNQGACVSYVNKGK
jgi:hypothetical protein